MRKKILDQPFDGPTMTQSAEDDGSISISGDRHRLQTESNASPPTDRSESSRSKPRCGAYARSTGRPCERQALQNGRCRNHGGLSTGPRTAEGKERMRDAVKAQWRKWRDDREGQKLDPDGR